MHLPPPRLQDGGSPPGARRTSRALPGGVRSAGALAPPPLGTTSSSSLSPAEGHHMVHELCVQSQGQNELLVNLGNRALLTQ